MKFPPDPGHELSGVEWLGGMPEHWTVTPLRFLVRFHGGATPDKSRSDYWDGSIPWVSPKDMKQARLSDAEDHVSEAALHHSPLSMIPSGAILIVVRGMILAHSFPVGLTEAPLTINQDMKALIARSEVDSRFLAWFLSGAAKAIVALADESAHGTRKLETATLGGVAIGVPSLAEQRAIVNFLDAQTANLDTLVAKKRALIERLQEKRTALISQAVIRGLPPDAGAADPKFKPSGIAWLADVPEHWPVEPLKRVVRFVEGPGIMATDFADEGVPLLRIAGIGGGKATLAGCDFLAPDLVRRRWSHFRVEIGDLLISGSASTGLCSEVDDATAGAIPYTGLIIVRPRIDRALREFMRWFFLSTEFLTQADLASTGSTIQHFGPSHLSRMAIVIPPLPEQRVIAGYLDRETAKIDQMIAKVEAAVERLQEYRSALITAAVTGKIDVRGHAA